MVGQLPDLSATDGDFGTTLLGLASGLPMVVMPLFADQPPNARRVEAIGAGIALEGGVAAISRLGDAVRQVLHDPSVAMFHAVDDADVPIALAEETCAQTTGLLNTCSPVTCKAATRPRSSRQTTTTSSSGH